MNSPNCGACGMLNSRGFCSLTACRFPVVNDLGTWQERILANKPKQTNADRIRSMTDEELAGLLEMIPHSGNPPTYTIDGFCIDDGLRTKSQWLDWLREEAQT